MPELPTANKLTTPLLAGAAGNLRPVLPMGAAGAAGTRPTPTLLGGAASARAATSSAAAAAGGPLAELRLIALFVAKYKLDPTRTKLLLAKLTPARRRYVIQNFKTAAASGGELAMKALEGYIAQCERTNSWGGAATPTAATAPARASPGIARSPAILPGARAPTSLAARAPAAMAARGPAAQAIAAAAAARAARAPMAAPFASMKRPLPAAMPQPYMPPATRPRIGSPGAMPGPSAAAAAARLAGVRAAAAAAPRPGLAGAAMSPRAAWGATASGMNRSNSWSPGMARPGTIGSLARPPMVLGGRPNVGGYRPMAVGSFGGGCAGYRPAMMSRPGLRSPW